jgi:hypothetical protein
LGIGDWGLGPIPNPQSPIPNPHPHLNYFITKKYLLNKFLNLNKIKLKYKTNNGKRTQKEKS